MPMVSSICSMRGMPSVVTVSTCVSPRWNSAGAVRGGDEVDVGRQRPDVGGAAAVDADALFDDARAHDLLLQRAERRT